MSHDGHKAKDKLIIYDGMGSSIHQRKFFLIILCDNEIIVHSELIPIIDNCNIISDFCPAIFLVYNE